MKTILTPKHLILGFSVVVILLVALSYVQLQRDVPDISVSAESSDPSAAQPPQAALQGGAEALALPWPEKGSAAVAVGGTGLVGSAGDERARPIASLTKVMTAYVILKDNPLTPGEMGPTIEIQQADVDLYLAQEQNQESVIPVAVGQTFTQEQMMQGLLIPSGNNFAHILAVWNSGSLEAFVERMNQEAAALGMTNTHYAEPSGISAETRSTAADQTLLAEAAMANPVIASIVTMKQATLPEVGVLYNVNSELGNDNQAGIKTGWTEEAGGCFMFAGNWVVDGQSVRIYGAVLGQDTLAHAFSGTRDLIHSVGSSLEQVTVVAANSEVGTITTPWGESATALAAEDGTMIAWPGLTIERSIEAEALSSASEGDPVGQVIYRAGNQQIVVPLIASNAVNGASISWRLTRL